MNCSLKFSALMVLAFVACVMLVAPVATVRAAVPTDDPPATTGTITVTGTGRVERTPDYMDVVVGVEATGKTAAGAQDECSKRMAAITAAINALALPGLDLKTGVIDLSPLYDPKGDRHDDDGRPLPVMIIGYRANATLRLRTTDIRASSRVIDGAIKAGANRVEQVSFGLKELLEAREEALRLAIKAARRKINVMADAMDIKLGKVLSISESSYRFGGWWPRSVNSGMQMAQMASSDAGFAPSVDTGIAEPGKVEVVVDVYLNMSIADENKKQ